MEIGDVVGGKEGDAVVGKAEQIQGQAGNEVEDVEAGASAENEEGDDELHQHSHDNGVPFDLPPVARGDVQAKDENQQTEEADGAVGAGVVLRFGAGEGADENDGDGKESAGGNAQVFRDHVGEPDAGVVPDCMHGLGDDSHGDVEGNETNCDC